MQRSAPNPSTDAVEGCIVSAEANTLAPLRGASSVARRRYQRGHLRLRGKRNKVWVAKWREDVVMPDGKIRRVQKGEVLGSLKEYKTKRLAERALEQRLAEVNSLTYKPRPTATFREFATKWKKDVLTQLKASTQSADRSRIDKHLIPHLGELCMNDLTAQRIQVVIAKLRENLSPKSVKNMIATLRIMWVQARAWDYVQHDPFFGLVLPDPALVNERFLSLDEMKRVIQAATEPYKTYYWILAETGVRAGEIGALPLRNALLDLGAIRIAQSVWHGKIQTVKSLKGNRVCEISPQLIEHLRQYIRQWRPNPLGLMFASKNGTPLDTDTVRKRKLYPLLKKLEIPQCGFYAFRHG